MRKFLFLFFLLPLTVSATSYTVKAAGGGSFTTIQACATAAVAGDTCTVFAGTYSETPLPAASGTAGNPITFQVNPGDCVTVTGFNLASLSYITLGTPGGAGCTKSGVNFTGFEFTGGHIAFVAINNVIIQNNYIHNTNDICIRGPGTKSGGAATFDYILNNVITLCGGGSIAGGMGNVEGNHWLIDGNTFSHVEDGIYLYADHVIVRNNHFGPITAAEEGVNHPDAIESSCTSGADFPLQHMIFENNVIQDWRSSNGHGLLLRDTQNCGQTDNVMRFNQFITLGSYLSSNETDSTNELWYNNSSNGDEADFAPKDFSNLTFTTGDTGANIINNSFANDWRPGNSPYCIFSDGTSTGLVENHNSCFLSGWNGSWQTSSFGSYAASDLFNRDPLYVNTASDLHIQVGSPNANAGGPLTTAVGSGSTSTALTVANASFFQDGYSLTNVQADWIRIGASATVQISSINYATNVITLASGQTWSNGASIYLYKNSSGTIVLNGANPNIGFDQGASVAPIAKSRGVGAIVIQ